MSRVAPAPRTDGGTGPSSSATRGTSGGFVWVSWPDAQREAILSPAAGGLMSAPAGADRLGTRARQRRRAARAEAAGSRLRRVALTAAAAVVGTAGVAATGAYSDVA